MKNARFLESPEWEMLILGGAYAPQDHFMRCYHKEEGTCQECAGSIYGTDQYQSKRANDEVLVHWVQSEG
jgi:hypothetical protein